MYEMMSRTRQCEERMQKLVMSGKLAIVIHLPWGQEAIAAGVAAAIRADDYWVSTYRSMHDAVSKGVPLTELWAEYMGRATGSCGGKSGPMHISDPAHGFMMCSAIVGGQIPIANGLALASKLQRNGRVTVVSFGDGATNIGAFHEALNLAQLWRLPIIFLCQNNLYGEHTQTHHHQSNEHVADRAAAYGMRGVTVDGLDPIAVWAAATEAADRARRGEGPTLLEAIAPRAGGHYLGDPADYVAKEWMEKAKAANPVKAFRTKLIDAGIASEAAVMTLENQITGEIDAAYEFASNSPFPELDTLMRDVYAPGISA
jgi:TPP-dependent pyruvate/acetoin dehydrogenase alpha subunit